MPHHYSKGKKSQYNGKAKKTTAAKKRVAKKKTKK